MPGCTRIRPQYCQLAFLTMNHNAKRIKMEVMASDVNVFTRLNPIGTREAGATSIGFYSEEMMLQTGLFDDSPRTREIIYNFMRLRALRVEVDVKLALGLFTMT